MAIIKRSIILEDKPRCHIILFIRTSLINITPSNYLFASALVPTSLLHKGLSQSLRNTDNKDKQFRALKVQVNKIMPFSFSWVASQPTIVSFIAGNTQKEGRGVV
jgi:hypothetical protein